MMDERVKQLIVMLHETGYEAKMQNAAEGVFQVVDEFVPKIARVIDMEERDVRVYVLTSFVTSYVVHIAWRYDMETSQRVWRGIMERLSTLDAQTLEKIMCLIEDTLREMGDEDASSETGERYHGEFS